ncbi:MAG: PEP-CTERM system TPR-repeat protein PrsT [Halioglobus sp.]|nr:PEP-CTERM system TPR-repeat protein PrsT [Halioglobus sp.]
MIRSALLLTIITLLYACGGGDERTSQEHIAAAQAYLEKNQQRPAVIELKNALQKDVNSTQARAMLGRLYFDLGDYEGASKELSRAVEMGAAPTTIMPVLAQTLLSLGEFRQLEELSLDALDPEGRSLVQAAKGLAQLFKGNAPAAEEIIATALTNETVSPYALVADARLSMARQEYPQARKKLKSIFKEHKDYGPAWNLLGDIEAAERRAPEAEKAYSNVLRVRPMAFDARLNRAMMRIYQSKFKEAREDLDTLMKTHAGAAKVHPGVNFARGIVFLQARQFVPAKTAFDKASQYSENYPLTHYYLAAIDMEQGLSQQALANVYRFLGIVPGSVVGAKLAAKLELQEQNYAKVEELLKPVLEAYPADIDALNLMASASLALGKGSEGVDLLLKVVELRPQSVEAQARLGAGFLAAGDEDLGIATLKDLLSADPGYEQADILIVLNYLRTRQTSEAISAAEDYRDRNPQSTTSYNLLGRAYLIAGRKKDAKAAFQKGLELRPDDPGANNSLADFKLEERDFEGARFYYKRVLDKNPDHMQTLMKLAASYAIEGREDEMFASLDRTLEAHPRAMEPRLVKARYFIARGDLDKAGAEFNALTHEQKQHPDALFTQAGFELAAGRHNQARITLEKLTRLRPNVSQYHYMMSKAYAGLGDLKKFTAELEKAVELDPDHFYAKLALARLNLVTGSNKQFRKHLAELKKVAPDNHDVMKLEVADADQRGEHKRAEQLLATLYEQSPTVGNVMALATHREKVGDAQGAVAALENWLDSHHDDLQVRQKIAQVRGSAEDIDGAIEEYRTIVSLDENNVVALNNLAWYLLERNPEQALVYAQQAFGLSPESSSVLDTLAMAQLATQRLPEARRTIDRALELSPDSPELIYHEARVRAAEGDNAGAAQSLAAVLAQHEDFYERDKAVALLEELQ